MDFPQNWSNLLVVTGMVELGREVSLFLAQQHICNHEGCDSLALDQKKKASVKFGEQYCHMPEVVLQVVSLCARDFAACHLSRRSGVFRIGVDGTTLKRFLTNRSRAAAFIQGTKACLFTSSRSKRLWLLPIQRSKNLTVVIFVTLLIKRSRGDLQDHVIV